MRRPLLLVAVLALAALLAGCGEEPLPEVTFRAGDDLTSIGPNQSCDVEITECAENAEAVATLRVPVGTPVRVGVPPEVAETPWQVVFRYRQTRVPGSDPIEGRSEVFAAGERVGYTLELGVGSQLETLEVQQFGLPSVSRGEPTFRVRTTWVLSVDDR